MRDVILLHGLWMPGLVMSLLAARLGRAGLRCHVFDYGGSRRPLEAHVERLARFAHERVPGAPAHFVGHSLGGLVVLEALSGERSLAVGNVVLLGTPAQGCLAGRRLAQRGVGRWMLGASEPLWRDGRAARWTREEPLGVIAGSMTFGLGRALGPLPGVSDGVVCIEETAVEGMRERIVLPVSHSAMLISSRVAAGVEAFLRDGKFASHVA